MSNESSDAFKIPRAPNRKFLCLGERRGNLPAKWEPTLFRDRAWGWGVSDRLRQGRDRQDRRIAEFSRNVADTAIRRRQVVTHDAASGLWIILPSGPMEIAT
jgi:hypothetical protein